MNSDDFHDQNDLWDLLGHARQPKVSPFFARNVVREARGLRREPASWLQWLFQVWQLRTAAVCALMLVTGLAFYGGRPARQAAEDSQLLAMAKKVSASPDYQVIGELDELLDSEQNSVWLSADAN